MIKQTIQALLPPGKWLGSGIFLRSLDRLEEEINIIKKKVDYECNIDFSQPTKVNAKWAKLLEVPQTDIEQTLRQEKGASLSYFSQFLTDGMEIEEIELFKIKVKNIKTEGFKAGDSIGDSKPIPIIELLETIKPAYVSFEYYNDTNGRIA